MANINQLSNELLLTIIDYLPSNTLHSLALTSRLFYSVVIQPLYSHIFFEGDGRYQKCLPGGEVIDRERNIKSFLNFKRPTNASRVKNLAMLARTIDESTTLRSLISHLDIAWPKSGVESSHLPRLHDNIRTSQNLHVHLYLSTFFASIHPESPVTFIAINNKTRPEEGYVWKKSDDYHYSRLMYRHFAILALKDIRLDMWDLWGFHIGPRTRLADTDIESRRGTSNVNRLEFHDCVPYEGMLDIITWPKALRSFSCTFHMNKYDPMNTQPISKGLQQAFAHQQHNLEEVSISSDYRTEEYTRLPDLGAQGLSFHDFSNLTRLCIDLDFLYPTGREWEYLFQRNASAPIIAGSRSLHILLPPCLVELQLILPFLWNMTDDMDDVRPDDVNSDIMWVYELKYLEDLAFNAGTHLPKLRRVGAGDAWHAESSWAPEEKVVSADGEKIKTMFEAAGIDFYYWKGEKPDFCLNCQ